MRSFAIEEPGSPVPALYATLVLINGIGYSPIASKKKVDAVRKRIMAMEKEDWNFEKMLIYQNKQGKNRAIPKETTVLMVKESSMKMTA